MNILKAICFGVIAAIASIGNAQFPNTDNVNGGFLDQEFVEDFTDPRYANASAYAPTNEWQEFSQTLTVGRDGQLSHVSIYGGGANVLATLSIYSTNQGLPDQLLGSRTLQPGSVYQWTTFDFESEGIDLLSGQVIALAMSGRFDWSASLFGNPYLRYEQGQVYSRQIKEFGEPLYNDGNWFLLNPLYNEGGDLLFRTYLTSIPEPATAALSTVALVCLAGLRRSAASRLRGA